jgi:hypothetical protein
MVSCQLHASAGIDTRILWSQRRHEHGNDKKHPVPVGSRTSGYVRQIPPPLTVLSHHHLLHELGPLICSGSISTDGLVESIPFLVDPNYFFLVVDTVELTLPRYCLVVK